MSQMSELAIEIETKINEGKSFVVIARELDIPIRFVIEVNKNIQETAVNEDCSPFATINS